MSAALLDALLSGYVLPSSAKAANPANARHLRGALADCDPSERLRASANAAPAEPDSQELTSIRNSAHEPQRKGRCGPSQFSQESQAVPVTITGPNVAEIRAVAWDDADIARFLDRRGRLMRWGWTEVDAERWAERLVRRDREGDTRVSCTDCGAYRPGTCRTHRDGGLLSSAVGGDLAVLLQHCPAFRDLDLHVGFHQPASALAVQLRPLDGPED